MPLYMIERAFAEQLELTSDDIQAVEQINADEDVRWVFSFLSLRSAVRRCHQGGRSASQHSS